MIRIGIGLARPNDHLVHAVREVANEGITPILFAPRSIPEISGIACRVSDNPERDLVDALMGGQIDAAVRGTLPAHSTLRYLREAAGVDHLQRVALLETGDGRQFLLAPVGIDEGSTIKSRIELIQKAIKLAEQTGRNKKVAILSGGRLEDIGRNPDVDRSLADAELIARCSGGDHCEILIEEVVGEYGIVIAPDGISGNLIFRTLVLLGSGTGHGAPVVNIDVPFVDTSRATEGFGNAIRLAKDLVRKK